MFDFFKIVIFDVSGAHFFRFWSVLVTPKIDSDPSKVVVLRKREHDFQKIMFLLLKVESPTKYKTHTQKPSQNHKSLIILEVIVPPELRAIIEPSAFYPARPRRGALGPILDRFWSILDLFCSGFGINFEFFWVRIFWSNYR